MNSIAWDSIRQWRISQIFARALKNNGAAKSDTSYNSYDATKGANNRSFINDVAGRVLYANQGGNVQRQLVVNGEVLGRFGTMLNPDKPADSAAWPRARRWPRLPSRCLATARCGT